MMALLEKQQKRIDQSSDVQGEFSPLFAFIKRFLHQIATVVPYESILCTIAYGNHKDTILRCINLIKNLNVEFPFSLTMYASVVVALVRLHGSDLELPADVSHPLEDYAYYAWLTTKLMDTRMRNLHASLQPDNQSEKQALQPIGIGPVNFSHFSQLSSSLLLANPLFNIDESKGDEYLTYLQEMAQEALKQQNVSQASAISDKSAVDLYKFQRDNLSLKSPIQALVQGREKLHKLSSCDGRGTSIRGANSEMITVLKNARGGQFDLCIGVTCGFMYQNVRVPFTEENPVTIWKTFRLAFGSIWDMIISSNSPPKAIYSMTKRCEKLISKGTDIAKSMYDGKLKFLISHIDPAVSAHAAQSSDEYSIYTSERKLKDLCSKRRITAETAIDDIVSTWRSHFEHDTSELDGQKRNQKKKEASTYYPLLDVAKSHRTLIARWIKWSLMVNDLRSKLEQYTTIAVAGLVNSGKTQLMRNLFGLDVSRCLCPHFTYPRGPGQLVRLVWLCDGRTTFCTYHTRRYSGNLRTGYVRATAGVTCA